MIIFGDPLDVSADDFTNIVSRNIHRPSLQATKKNQLEGINVSPTHMPARLYIY